MKFITSFLLAYVFILTGTAAQDIVFSEPIKPAVHDFATIVGRVADAYIICEALPKPYGAKALRVFNQEMQQVGDPVILPIPTGAMNTNVCLYNGFLLLTYVEQKENQLYYKAIKLGERGVALGSPIVLDSFADPLRLPGSWDMVMSADKKKLLISRVSYQVDSAVISTCIFDRNLSMLEQCRQTIFVAHRYERLGAMLLSNDGDIYLPVYPGAPGRMVSRFEILSKAYGSELYNAVLVDLKTRLVNMGSAIIKVEDSRDTSTLIIGAICYNSTNHHGPMEGLFTVRVRAATNQSRAVVNKFRGSMQEGETSDVSLDPNSRIQLEDAVFVSNGGIMIVAKHDKSKTSTYSRPRSFIGVDVSPRFTYDPTGFRVAGNAAWSPDMFLESRSYSPGTYTFREPYNKDILVYYIDSSLVLKHQKMIKKNQVDLKRADPAYLDFGMVNTSTAVHFLYREIKKGGGLIRNTSFSPNGEIQRLPPLRTVDNLYKLMPSLAAQVGPRQAIIPGTYRGKRVYAKVDF